MRKSLVGIALALGVWLAPTALYATASSSTSHSTTTHFSAAQCDKVFRPISNLSTTAKASLGHPCYAVVTVSGGAPKAIGGALASTACYGFWTGWDWYNFVGIWIFGDRVNVGMCFTGSVAYKQWGVDCPIATLPGDGYQNQWCGMYQNNTSAPQAGNNYDITLLYNGSPIVLGHGWLRAYFTPQYINYVYGCFEADCAYGYT